MFKNECLECDYYNYDNEDNCLLMKCICEECEYCCGTKHVIEDNKIVCETCGLTTAIK
jgi:hypothetical protein